MGKERIAEEVEIYVQVTQWRTETGLTGISETKECEKKKSCWGITESDLFFAVSSVYKSNKK